MRENHWSQLPGESPGSPCSTLASVNIKNVSFLFVWNNVPCVTAVHVSPWCPKWLVLPAIWVFFVCLTATFSSYLKAGVLWGNLLLGTVPRGEH